MKPLHIFSAIISASLISSCSLLGPKVSPMRASVDSSTRHSEKTTDKQKTDEITNVKDLQERVDGEWIIVDIAGKQISGIDDMPYITFEKQTGRFYASNTCNVINGSYSIGDDASLALTDVLSTMKLCSDNPYEALITEVLSGEKAIKLSIRKLANETFLQFAGSNGNILMTAKKHNMDFLNGNWQILSVKNIDINDDSADIFIDINELKIHGNTGCNFFNGDIYIDPDKTNAIDFSNIGLTRMACPKHEQESAIIIALEETAGAIKGDNGQVMFLDAAGNRLMILKSIPVKRD